jgi:hypothetical protein
MNKDVELDNAITESIVEAAITTRDLIKKAFNQGKILSLDISKRYIDFSYEEANHLLVQKLLKLKYTRAKIKKALLTLRDHYENNYPQFF